MENKLSHTDEQGKARMVNVGDKSIVQRMAKAGGMIYLDSATLTLVKENALKKGHVLSVAEVAGIQAAKNTWALIPLCHNIPLDHVLVSCILCENGIQVTSEVRCTGKTGVEMEALTAVSVALLTVYDMCKAVDKHMKISEITLLEKSKTPITA